jgi:hypothetical protein
MFRLTTIIALVVVLPTEVHSAAIFSNLVQCEDITAAEGEEPPFRVCATYGATTPSPFDDGNTSGYAGNWDYFFGIYHPVAEGFSEGDFDFPNEAFMNMTVHVARSSADDSCNVTVTTGGVDSACSSCTWCGANNETGDADETEYSADCTNVENGRSVTCESTDILYFPLTADALPNVTIPPPGTGGGGGGGGNTSEPAPAPAPSTTSAAASPYTMDQAVFLLKMIGSLVALTLV